jgi:hypothetical protein
MAVGPSTAGPNQEQGQTSTNQVAESDDDVVEEIQGHPQDGWQHMYVCREHGDHYVCHKEISIDEEMERVERVARRLIREVQVSVLLDKCCRPALVCGHTQITLYVTCRAS